MTNRKALKEFLTPQECEQLKTVAVQAAQRAGELLRQEAYLQNGPRGNQHKTPVDEEAEIVIIELISKAFPNHGITGEEATELHRQAKNGSKFHWYIDPNDGTSAFFSAFRGHAVSIGLIYEHSPIFGVVYAPTYPNDRGDLIYGGLPELFGPLIRNDCSIPNERPIIDIDQAIVAVSQSADKKTKQNIDCSLSGRFFAIPSIAYRLALAAVGDVEAGVSLAYPTHFDCAAGHALLRAVGYELYIEQGVPMTYDRSVSGRVIIGGQPDLCHRLYELPWSSVLSGKSTKDTLPYGLTRAQWPLRVKEREKEVLTLAQGAILGMLIGGALGEQNKDLGYQREPEQNERDTYGIDLDHLLYHESNLQQAHLPPLVEQAILLARSIIRAGKYDSTLALKSYVKWFTNYEDEQQLDRLDIITKESLSLAKKGQEQGLSIDEIRALISEQPRAESQSNTALLRAVILGLFGSRLPLRDLMDLARLDASLTHPSVLCQDAHALIAIQVATYIQCIGYDKSQQKKDWCPNPNLRAHEAVFLRLQQLDFNQLLKDLGMVFRDLQVNPPSNHSVLDAVREVLEMNMWFRRYQSGDDSQFLFKYYIKRIAQRGGRSSVLTALMGATMGMTVGVENLPQKDVLLLNSSRPLIQDSWDDIQRPRWAWSIDSLVLAEQLIATGLIRHQTSFTNLLQDLLVKNII